MAYTFYASTIHHADLPIVESFESYCILCDLWFSSRAKRAEHVAECDEHPCCVPCGRQRFLNGYVLRYHLMYSCFHHYCSVCDVDFESKSALRLHYKHFMSRGDHNDLNDGADGANDLDLFGVHYDDEHSFLDFKDSEYGSKDEEELIEESTAEVSIPIVNPLR